jgi:hypothetical protein
MSATVLITINVALDAAILGALPFVMSHASRLTPHEEAELTSRASATELRRWPERLGR